MPEHEKKLITPAVINKDGHQHRMWWMPERDKIGCMGPGCENIVADLNKPEEVEKALYFFFPSRNEPIVDQFYFCSWHCVAGYVRLQDDARVAFSLSAEAPTEDDKPEPPSP